MEFKEEEESRKNLGQEGGVFVVEDHLPRCFQLIRFHDSMASGDGIFSLKFIRPTPHPHMAKTVPSLLRCDNPVDKRNVLKQSMGFLSGKLNLPHPGHN